MNYETEKVSNVLLVAITRMGDMLQASPTIVGIKQDNPDAKVTVLVEQQFTNICKGIPGIDEIYSIDLSYVVRALHREKDGVVEAYKYLDDAVKDLRSRNYDCVINMSSSAYTALLLKMLDAKNSRGWISDDEGHRLITNPWTMLFAAFVYHSNRDYNSLNLVDIFRCSAGVEQHPRSLKYGVTDEAKVFADEFFGNKPEDASKPIICIQAGASQEKRQWPTSRFAAVARMLVEQLNARVVFTGSASEARLIQAILNEYSNPNVVSIAGLTNIPQLAAILKRADLLITGDTGPMHLAVAVDTPVVALFLASALCFETGPYSEGNIVIQPQVGCNPCNPNFPCSRPDCHFQVTPELVVHLTKLLLSTEQKDIANLRVPEDLAPGSEVAIYATVFDSDEFLDFKQLNKMVARNGFPSGYYQQARNAYRQLWKEEFGSVPFNPEPKFVEPVSGFITADGEAAKGLSRALTLAEQGLKLIDRLIQLINDTRSAPHLLGEVNNQINEIDRNIEELGLRHAIIGALVRIFVMEKENMRGEDPLLLASEMKELYQSLVARIKRFATLLGLPSHALNQNAGSGVRSLQQFPTATELSSNNNF